MQLNDKLYTSTEVADILGVSLRSVYRYIDEDKLEASIKTRTGRLRFTKQNILDFLHPDDTGNAKSRTAISSEEGGDEDEGSVKVKVSAPKEQKDEPEEQEDVEVEEDQTAEETEEVDWLEKFRASAEKFKQKTTEPVKQTVSVKKELELSEEPISNLTEDSEEEPVSDVSYSYYRSMVGGLKDIAQNIDKVSRRSNIEYAFTLYAGLSLYKPLKNPFSILHVYVKPEDKELYERLLRLVPSDEDNAQLCLVTTEEDSVFADKQELHGLYVVSKEQLKEDINGASKEDLIEEFQGI